MQLYMDPVYLNYFEALASATRLRMIQLLSVRDMNVKELSEALDISSTIVTKHVRKLKSAKIITTNNITKDGSRHKMCTLLNTTFELKPPPKRNDLEVEQKMYEVSIPVGQYIDLAVEPPCGIADERDIIGDLDDCVQMISPARVGAQLLWFGEGYVEYMLPNYLRGAQTLTGIELSGEFGSEAAGFNDHWPSKINVELNGKHLCSFTTPGDFGSRPGTLTPKWWLNNQYGIMVVIRLTSEGVMVNGEKKSDVTLADFNSHCDKWILRFSTEGHNKDGGGLTIFGEKFGNYAQNILFHTLYE